MAEWEWSRIRPDFDDVPIWLLALHDWTPDLTEEEREHVALSDEQVKDFWWGFRVSQPFACDDDVFHDPGPFPYSRFPVQLHEDSLLTPLPINSDQEARIQAIVDKGERLLKIIESVRPHWDFVELAMGYLGKAFLADRSMEQLLWNVTVLDCLLSEKTEVQQSMRRRIGNILGSTQRERKEIGNQFTELYSFRSDLVHGNRFDKRVRYRHLANARDLARRVLVWFIDYLLWIDEDLRQREISYTDYPRRDELLIILDFEGSISEPPQ